MSRLFNILRKLRKDEILRLSGRTCKHGHSLVSHPQCIEETMGIRIEETIGVLDIESSNLKADYGYMISYSIVPLVDVNKKKPRMYGRSLKRSEIIGNISDRELIRECIRDMQRFDRIVTYYGQGFDIPFLRTRAVFWNLRFPAWGDLFQTDLFQIIKHKFNMHRKSLQVACETFGIKAKGHPLTPKIWLAAATGKKYALEYILKHNREDVVSTGKLWNKVNEYAQVKKSSL